mmetsp:Transcript_32339/g.55976  ORF Transcript_32339/g.55976 Transcript_32339/m.55976 type:complete len:237 (+) Transcript_32339:798-1508(+)
MLVTERFLGQLEEFLKNELPPSFFTNDKFLITIILEAFNNHSKFKELRAELVEHLSAFLEDDTEDFMDKLQKFYKEKAKAEPPIEEAKAVKPVRTDSFDSQPPPAIFLRRVPPQVNKAHALTEYFTKFGNVVRVSAKPQKGTAQIFFESEDSADAALSSLEPVLGDKRILKEILQLKKPVNHKVAREIKHKKQEFAEERTAKVRHLLHLLNEKKDSLTSEQHEALLSKIQQLRTLQ